mmetsp:Transcript_15113/g.19928  ORF Transcript_15113/g.19928 Transcript_15113/m.19928 type:complete len:264 (+) Transcript_15113:164-955(+)
MAISSEVLEKLWFQICNGLTNEEVANRWWVIIVDRYGEPQRHYHTLSHLMEMFALNMVYQDRISNPDLVGFAIFFHDLIYEPKSKTNEEDSAISFKQFAAETMMDQEKINMIDQYILATKTHAADDLEDSDLAFFLDFDMAVLGRSWEGYLKYAHQVRQEYIHIPKETYCSARAEVLTSFLNVKWIYASKEFQEKYEQQARKNIQMEIEMLQNGNIPTSHRRKHGSFLPSLCFLKKCVFTAVAILGPIGLYAYFKSRKNKLRS